MKKRPHLVCVEEDVVVVEGEGVEGIAMGWWQIMEQMVVTMVGVDMLVEGEVVDEVVVSMDVEEAMVVVMAVVMMVEIHIKNQMDMSTMDLEYLHDKGVDVALEWPGDAAVAGITDQMGQCRQMLECSFLAQARDIYMPSLLECFPKIKRRKEKNEKKKNS